ncbi:hypothetical protein LXL04_010524 [Taraxacum kok-saghyz]
MHSRRLGGKVSASQRGYRKVRGRLAARKREKGKELEVDVRICLEEQLPDDPEILDIAEMLRLNVPMAMKLAFDSKDSNHKTRDSSVDDVGQFESVELSIVAYSPLLLTGFDFGMCILIFWVLFFSIHHHK